MSTKLFAKVPEQDVMDELGRQMQLISEDATCSAWHSQVAEELPRLCYAIAADGKPRDFRGTPVSVPLARSLVAMASHLGHWVEVGLGGKWVAHRPQAMCLKEDLW